MNAVVRSLLSLNTFVDYLIKAESVLTSRTPHPEFFVALVGVQKKLKENRQEVISLADLKAAIAKYSKRFASYTQEVHRASNSICCLPKGKDAHEFLISSLCLLEDEVLAFKKGERLAEEKEATTAAGEPAPSDPPAPPSAELQLFDEDKPLIAPEGGTESTSPLKVGDEADKDTIVNPTDAAIPLSPEEAESLECPVAAAFDCIVEVTIICKNCKQCTVLEELYRDFSLDIPQSRYVCTQHNYWVVILYLVSIVLQPLL